MRINPLPFLAIAAMSAVAGCVPSAAPPPRPVERPAAPMPPQRAVPPPLASDWRDWPVTPGDWAYRQDARGSIALFGPVGGDALLTLRCDRTRRTVFLSRPGGSATALTLRTSTTARVLDARPTGGEPPYVAVALQPRDEILEAMGFSRGHFVIEQAGLPPLVVPAWAEILRVTEDCRA